MKATLTIEVDLEFLDRVLKLQPYSNSFTPWRYIIDLSDYKGSAQEEYPVIKIDFNEQEKTK